MMSLSARRLHTPIDSDVRSFCCAVRFHGSQARAVAFRLLHGAVPGATPKGTAQLMLSLSNVKGGDQVKVLLPLLSIL